MSASTLQIAALFTALCILCVRAGFVEVDGTAFVDRDACGSQPIRLVGYNTYRSVEYAVKYPYRTREQMRRAREAELNFVRAWAFSTKSDLPLLTGYRELNERVLKGLDLFLDEARRNSLRVILVLLDWWQSTGGVIEVLEKAGTNAQSRSDFYTDQGARATYTYIVRTILSRRNSVSGRMYRDDPTIMAYELLNEPRAPSVSVLSEWVATMSRFAKSIDNRHLLSIGIEGFFADTSTQERRNLRNILGPWSLATGQDFTKLHELSTIDFATTHLWAGAIGCISSCLMHPLLKSFCNQSSFFFLLCLPFYFLLTCLWDLR